MKKETFLHHLKGKNLTYKRYTKSPLRYGWNERHKNPNNKPKEDKNRYLKALEKIRAFKTHNLKVEMASFEAVFEKYPNDFFYCDPPYFWKGILKCLGGFILCEISLFITIALITSF